jgi:hypothetical protein
MSLLPLDQPVTGEKVRALFEERGFLKQAEVEAIIALGLDKRKAMALYDQDPEAPLSDVSHALMIRLLDLSPGLFEVPYEDVFAFKAFLDACLGTPLHPRHFSVMMGFSANAVDRWRRGDAPKRSVTVLAYYLKKALLRLPQEQRKQAIHEWAQVVHAEASARGIPDVFNCEYGWPRLRKDAHD